MDNINRYMPLKTIRRDLTNNESNIRIMSWNIARQDSIDKIMCLP
jgi:hypothetical protein